MARRGFVFFDTPARTITAQATRPPGASSTASRAGVCSKTAICLDRCIPDLIRTKVPTKLRARYTTGCGRSSPYDASRSTPAGRSLTACSSYIRPAAKARSGKYRTPKKRANGLRAAFSTAVRQQSLSQRYRAFRRSRNLGLEARSRVGGHRRERRYCTSRQRAALLGHQHHARWRRRRLRHQPARVGAARKRCELPGQQLGHQRAARQYAAASCNLQHASFAF